MSTSVSITGATPIDPTASITSLTITDPLATTGATAIAAGGVVAAPIATTGETGVVAVPIAGVGEDDEHGEVEIGDDHGGVVRVHVKYYEQKLAELEEHINHIAQDIHEDALKANDLVAKAFALPMPMPPMAGAPKGVISKYQAAMQKYNNLINQYHQKYDRVVADIHEDFDKIGVFIDKFVQKTGEDPELTALPMMPYIAPWPASLGGGSSVAVITGGAVAIAPVATTTTSISVASAQITAL